MSSPADNIKIYITLSALLFAVYRSKEYVNIWLTDWALQSILVSPLMKRIYYNFLLKKSEYYAEFYKN